MNPTPPVSPRVRIARLPHGAGLPLPEYQTPGASGLDLRAALAEPLTLEPGQRRDVPTGLAIALSPGLEAQVRPRSGLALRNGVTVLNAPGTVDSDYRGEIRVILINLGQEAVTIQPAERIAQLVFARVVRIEWECAPTLEATERGAGGFGHTGR